MNQNRQRRRLSGAARAAGLPAFAGLAGLAAVLLFAGGLPLAAAPAGANERVVHLYTGRHYPADRELYDLFQAKTGIRVRALEGKTGALLEKLRLEGEDSPADVFMTVDAGNLWRAEQAGLFQPLRSPVLESRIPAAYRSPDDLWFGFATRNRIAYYAPARVSEPPASWEDLADPRFRGRICVRSSSNIYNLSLLSSFIASEGAAAAEAWARAVRANMARKPAGGDTDQIRAVAAGVCDLAIGNHYYYARLLASGKEGDRAVTDAVKPLWLGEDGAGVHANISGAGLLRSAKNTEEARAFLEFLASDEAQAVFAAANNEYPVAEGVALSDALRSLGRHRTAPAAVAVYGRNQEQAQRIYDRVGWE